MIAPVDLVPIGKIADFQQSHRYVLSFRSWTKPAEHQQILIYRSGEGIPRTGDDESPKENFSWFSISNECPHLGLPLEAGDIEDLGSSVYEEEDEEEEEEGGEIAINQPLIICPFHQYDYSMKDGRSSTGSAKACTYKIEAREDGKLWIQPPGDRSDDFRILGIRMVSERFADSSPSPAAVDLSALLSSISLNGSPVFPTLPKSPSSVSEPTSIVGWCRMILLAPSPTAKVILTRHLVQLFRSGQVTKISDPSNDPPQPSSPYRDPELVKTVAPGKAGSRGKGGSVQSRIKLLHALAAIEQWAIDLAIDCISRFHDWKLGTMEGKKGNKRLPWSHFSDFLKIAEDEAKHFTLLVERLEQMGCKYGELAVHGALWESAIETSHSLFSRLAIIHLVHEARGLDSNPMQIKRCRAAGDEASASLLEIIHYDEITHVASGHRHFLNLCENHQPPLDPIQTFRKEVETHFYGQLKGPFNEEDRDKAGMQKGYYENLRGRGYGLGPKETSTSTYSTLTTIEKEEK
ncbi:hypothetical protein JCM5350_006757 [Sporobolomyces pararoseus]